MKTKWKLLFSVFYVFFKISPMTFGGGYAMLTLIEHEVVDKYGWLKKQDMPDILAVSQSVPGAVAINIAIIIGYRIAGLLGSLLALIGIVLPALIIVVLMSVFFLAFSHHPIVGAIFKGIGASVIALIVYAGFTMRKTAIIDRTTFLLTILSIIVLVFFPVNPVWVILFGLGIGFLIRIFRTVLEGRKEEETVENLKQEKKHYL
ncbi:MAG: chromate transporter [Bacillota bacterium]